MPIHKKSRIFLLSFLDPCGVFVVCKLRSLKISNHFIIHSKNMQKSVSYTVSASVYSDLRFISIYTSLHFPYIGLFQNKWNIIKLFLETYVLKLFNSHNTNISEKNSIHNIELFQWIGMQPTTRSFCTNRGYEYRFLQWIRFIHV